MQKPKKHSATSIITVIEQFNYDTEQYVKTREIEGSFDLDPFGSSYVIESVGVQVRREQTVITIRMIEHGDPELMVPLLGFGLFISQNIPPDEQNPTVQ